MPKTIVLKVLPHEAANEELVKEHIATAEALPVSHISGYFVLKQSIDARSKQAWINLTVQAFINEPYHNRELLSFNFQDVHLSAHHVIIIGGGPAGLFAALKLIECGIKSLKEEKMSGHVAGISQHSTKKVP